MISENISKTLVFLLVLWYNSIMRDRLSQPSLPSPQEALFDYPEQDSSASKMKRPDWSIVRDDTNDDGGDNFLDRRVDQGVSTVYGAKAAYRGVFPDQYHLKERPIVTEPPVSPGELKRGRDIKDRQVLYLRNLELSGITEEGEYLLKIQEFIRKDKERIEGMALIGVTVSGVDSSKYIKFGEPVPAWSDLEFE